MRHVLLLLNVRAMMTLKGITDLRWHAVSRNLSSLIIFGGVAIGTFLIVRSFTGYLVHRVQVDVAVLHSLLSFVLFSLFFSVHGVGLLISYTTMYVSEDSPFLMSLPVHPAAIFHVRMIENILTSAATISLLGLAGVLGYGSVFHLHVAEYLAIMFGVFVPFVLIAGMLAVIAVCGLVILAGRIGVRWMLACVLPLYGAATYAVMSAMNPAGLIKMAVSSPSSASLGQIGLFQEQFTWIPHQWVAEFLYALVRGEGQEAVGYAGLLLGALALVTGVAIYVGHRWYALSWFVATELRSRQPGLSAPRTLPFLGFETPWPIRPHVEAILKRDILLFLRDPVQRLHLLMMLFLASAVVFSVRSLDVVVHRPASMVMFFVIVFVSVGFLVSSVSLRFVFPAVSLEGDAFWSVRTAPIGINGLYWLKFSLLLAFVLVPAEIALWASLSAFRGWVFLRELAAVAMACLGVALISLNLGVGAYYATLKEKNPVKVASSQGASLTFLGSLIVLLVLGGILSLPAAAHLGASPGIDPRLATGVGLGGVVIIAVLVTLLANQLGLRSLRKDF